MTQRRPTWPTVITPGSDLVAEWWHRLLSPSTREVPVAERLERILLGGERRYTRAEVEERSGVDRERAERLWRALGFADVDDDDIVFTDADVQALGLIVGLVDSGFLDPSVESAAARAVGQSLSRLAEWENDLLNDYVLALIDAGHAPDEATILRFAETALPTMERLHSYVWRRHIAAVAGRALAASAEEVESSPLVVGFADVVGYTRLSRQLTERELAQLIERFESTATEVVATHGGRIVKTLGDEVLFVIDDPSAAADLALQLIERVDADGNLPTLRVGMARGNVLSRFGDVYGPVVNVASRLTSAAKPGGVLVDRELASALADAPGFALRRRRPMKVRGYSNLSSWRLSRRAVT